MHGSLLADEAFTVQLMLSHNPFALRLGWRQRNGLPNTDYLPKGRIIIDSRVVFGARVLLTSCREYPYLVPVSAACPVHFVVLVAGLKPTQKLWVFSLWMFTSTCVLHGARIMPDAVEAFLALIVSLQAGGVS